MNNIDFFTNKDISEHRKSQKYRRERRVSVHLQEWDIIHAETIGQHPDSCSCSIIMGHHHNGMAQIYELLCKMVHMEFDSSRLWVEEVGDHRNVVRSCHCAMVYSTVGNGKVMSIVYMQEVVRYSILYTMASTPL